MISYLLMLHFKQRCNSISEAAGTTNTVEDAPSLPNSEEEAKKKSNRKSPSRVHRYDLVTMLGRRLQRYWKIGIHWLITLRNLLFEKLTAENIRILAT